MKGITVIFIVVIIVVFLLAIIYNVSAFSGFGVPQNATWYNISWHYRIKLVINSTQVNRTNWPLEYNVNFTDLLPEGTFDINSPRVVEYSNAGALLQEVPSQFDADEGYNASNNAAGMLIFIMNGTTERNKTRTYFVYYDTAENGQKPAANYSTSIIYKWDSQNTTIHINNSLLVMHIDTNREENTSGLFRVKESQNQNVILNALANARTAEYLEYFNGTNNISYNLITNVSFVSGPVRLTIIQEGNEILFGNVSRETNETRVKKKYYIYNATGTQAFGGFVRITQKISNNVTRTITRNSTPSGALAFDVARTLSSGSINTRDANSTDPYSWAWVLGIGGEFVGLVKLNESGTQNYSILNGSSRIGAHLSNTTIPENNSIEVDVLAYFGAGGSDAVSEFIDVKDGFANAVTITASQVEMWTVTINPRLNFTTYNRNETILIIGNVSGTDPYNLTKSINVSVNNGTLNANDDFNITLFDNGSNGDAIAGDKLFTNTFVVPVNANITTWRMNFSAYDNSSNFLNATLLLFNVTDSYNVTVDIFNPVVLVNGIVTGNVYVRNYRVDTWISNANVSCQFDSTPVANITDRNNGTYSINFTAPSSVGSFTLLCNATRAGNAGNNTDLFTTETSETTVNVTSDKILVNISRIGMFDNESFVITANATNSGNGTAYNTNISLELFTGWNANITLQNCGNINNGSSCSKIFNITVPNGTSPGNYVINVTVNWTNPGNTPASNKTSVNVTVLPNPKINITPSLLEGNASDGGNSTAGNFTMQSTGNADLQNITFSCLSGIVCQDFGVIFNPSNISNISVGSGFLVYVNTSVPLNYTPGTYNGTINVSATNTSSLFTLNVVVAQNTTLSITLIPANYTAFNITQKNNETFSFVSNATNPFSGSARFVNISIGLFANLSSNATLQQCQNLTTNQYCERTFYITILNATYPVNFSFNITATWTNNDNTTKNISAQFNITVASNPVLNLTNSSLVSNATEGTNSTVGNFTVQSIGNDALKNISFSCSSGAVCSNFTVTFLPQNISSVAAGVSSDVIVNISIPDSFDSGTYGGQVNISASNDGSKILIFNITVPSNRAWELFPASCSRTEYPDEGLVCIINVTNTGNDVINFTITPVIGNKSYVNVTNFTVNRQSNYSFSVLYNITNSSQIVYNTTFTISALQQASPQNLTFNITLLPFIPPIVVLEFSKNAVEQKGQLEIFANVTDQSQTGINSVVINITRPNNTIDSTGMNQVSVSGNLSRWKILYPNVTANVSFGSSSERGRYEIFVLATDAVQNIGNKTGNFSVYINFSVIATTLADAYFQGDIGTIYYSIRDNSNSGVFNATAAFKVFDNNNNVTFSNAYQTNTDGTIVPLPTFTLPSDVPEGNYSLLSNTTYFDSLANITVNATKNKTFTVQEKTVTVQGLFADIETAVVWYPNSVMRFAIFTFNGEGQPVNPSAMTLNVFDPALNQYFSVNMSSMSQQGTGYFIYSYSMPPSTSTGMYLAVLNVTSGSLNTMKLHAFRVAQGGPYDLRVEPLTAEAAQESTIDFRITIQNMGEVSQDVFLEYWISSLDGSANYSSQSEFIFTPLLANQTFTRTLNILSTQLPGNYKLNTRMTYDPVQSPLTAQSTFLVVSSAQPSQPSTAGGGGDGAGGGSITSYATTREFPEKITEEDLLITSYNSKIRIARGKERVESVIVKNVGKTNANYINFVILGINGDWYTVKPETYRLIEPEQSAVFLIDFHIPDDAELGDYTANLLVSSSSSRDQKQITVTIVESLEELVTIEINQLKEELDELKRDTEFAEKEGKYVDNVKILIAEIEKLIASAEKNLADGKLDDALKDVDAAKNLLIKAKDLLSKIELIRVEAEQTPLLLLVALVIAIIISVISVYKLWATKQQKIILRPHVTLHFHKIKEKLVHKPDKKQLSDEKEKILRMQEVLEKERKEGIVSDSAYKEMKKGLDEKLDRIEKKMK